MKINTTDSDVLLIIDVQNDFCPGGALEVSDGNAVVPFINEVSEQFEHIVLTQDWHPSNHSSFASNHENAAPFTMTEMAYGPQTLWPDHCIQGSAGAEFHQALRYQRAELVIRKGFRTAIDSYSAFYENDQITPTGLGGYLKERAINRVFCVGLATDFCVRFSAEDARKLGFDTTVLLDGCRAIDMDGSLSAAIEAMKALGIKLT